MEKELFMETLRAFARRTPFQFFTVELTSGARIEVTHPEALAFYDRLAVHISRNGAPQIFDNDSVSQFIGAPDSQPKT